MPRLTLSFLGSPRILVDDIPITSQTSKSTALLAYLALNPKPHRREQLTGMLWSENSFQHAHGALRTALWRLKQSGLSPWLDIQRDTVALIPNHKIQVDVLDFHNLLEQCSDHPHSPTQVCQVCESLYSKALTLYRGDFLEGYSMSSSPEFEDWRLMQRESLRIEAITILGKLVKAHSKAQEIEQALFYARRWLYLDRYNEEAHRQLMFLYASLGQRSAALSQFRNCKKMLRQQRLDPQEETIELYHQILRGEEPVIVQNQALDSTILLFIEVKYPHNPGYLPRDLEKATLHFTDKVREKVKQYGGMVVKQSSRSAVLFFEKGQPLHYILWLYKHFSEIGQNTNDTLQMTVALHAAEPGSGNIDSYADDIQRTTRLLTAGWEGQVLLTSQAIDVIDPPKGAQFKDLGIHQFKDLREPLHIYGLIHPDLPAKEFPPIQSLSVHRHNLPVYTTSFIDREKELASLAGLLSQEGCRLLTLTGLGGVGKTRLAMQAAAQQIENFADGVFYITLTSPTSGDLIPSLLAELFHLVIFAERDLTNVVKDYLRHKAILLVMDNFEHMVQNSKILTDLLEEAPGLKMLVTSREPLNLYGEWIYEVNGMIAPPPEVQNDIESYGAVQLFLQNARRVYPGFNPSKEDLVFIGQISRLVDGLPLALILASSWVRTFTCQEITLEIEKSLDFLETSMHNLPPRHRSLRAIFDYTWSLLSEEDHRVFRRLSLFRGSFSLEAAQHISNVSALNMAAFVDHSMLHRASQGRYHISGLLRHYAFIKLQENPEDYQATLNIFCDYYAAYCQQIFTGTMHRQEEQVSKDIRTEIGNVRAAWNWAVEYNKWDSVEKFLNILAFYSEIMGRFQEVQALYQTAINKLDERLSPETERIRAKIQLQDAWILFVLGDQSRSIQQANHCLATCRRLEAPNEIATALYILATFNRRLGNPGLARQQALEALAIFQEIYTENDTYVVALTIHTKIILGLATFQSGQPEEARNILQDALQALQQTGGLYGESRVLEVLAKIALSQGKLEETEMLRMRAVEISTQIGDMRTTAILYNNLGDYYDQMGDVKKSIRYFSEAIKYAHEVGDRRLMGISLNNLAYSHIKYYQDFQAASRLYQESIGIFREIPDHLGVMYTTYDLAEGYLQAGELTSAKLNYQEALRNAFALDDLPAQLYTLYGIVHYLAVCKHTEEVVEVGTLILSHPQTDPKVKERTQNLISCLEDKISPESLHAAQQRGEAVELHDLVSHYISAF